MPELLNENSNGGEAGTPRRLSRDNKALQEIQSSASSPLSSPVSAAGNDTGNEQALNSAQASELPKQSPADAAPRRSSRKAQNKSSQLTQDLADVVEDPLKYVMAPTAASDLEAWKGWCEVESEPAFFNVMLRSFGAKDIKCQEIFSLDDEMLGFIPKPIYGLIFLFRFKEDDPAMQEATCPDSIWFANQTTGNACASIALLNTVMNVRGIELGPVLEQLREFSMPLTPALRGYAVGNHDYLRKIHNSFSRKMDVLNADLFLSNDANSRNSNAKQRGESRKSTLEEEQQAGFHFVTFVPIDGSLWKLDGLERQPMNLGDYKDEDWMNLARPILEERMRRYEGDQIQFSLLALCQSPLITIKNDLASNIRTIAAIEGRLQQLQSDWRQFVADEGFSKILRGPDHSYGITLEGLQSASISPAILQELEDGLITIERLLEHHKQLSNSQTQLRTSFVEEATSIKEDDERATTRRHDYTPVVNTWLAALADSGVLKDLVNTASGGLYYD